MILCVFNVQWPVMLTLNIVGVLLPISFSYLQHENIAVNSIFPQPAVPLDRTCHRILHHEHHQEVWGVLWPKVSAFKLLRLAMSDGLTSHLLSSKAEKEISRVQMCRHISCIKGSGMDLDTSEVSWILRWFSVLGTSLLLDVIVLWSNMVWVFSGWTWKKQIYQSPPGMACVMKPRTWLVEAATVRSLLSVVTSLANHVSTEGHGSQGRGN